MATVPFFYDRQVRRFLQQFIRLISGFQVQFGSVSPVTGALALQTVPVMYGDPSRQVAAILRGVSENSMATVPAMSVYIANLEFDQSRLQDPFFVGRVNVRERRVDPDTGQLTMEQGDSLTVERPMPMPYKLTLKLDIWTSNTEQKLQLWEQIVGLFNPSLEIQSTDNYVDWTSLSAVLLTSTQWDSRTVPTGSEEAISIATMNFELPIWISSPVRISRMGIVERMISSMADANGEDMFTVLGGGFGPSPTSSSAAAAAAESGGGGGIGSTMSGDPITQAMANGTVGLGGAPTTGAAGSGTVTSQSLGHSVVGTTGIFGAGGGTTSVGGAAGMGPTRATSVLNYGVELRGNQLRLLRFQDTVFSPEYASASNIKSGRGGRIKITEVDELGGIVSAVIRSIGNNYPATGYKVRLNGGAGGSGATVSWSGGTGGQLPKDFVSDPSTMPKGSSWIYIANAGTGYYLNDIITVTGVNEVLGSSGNLLEIENWPCPCNIEPDQLGDYVVNRAGEDYSWLTFTEQLGDIRAGLSQIRLQPDSGGEIVGTIAVHPADPTILIYDAFPDTVPSNTMRPLNAIIDPLKPGIEKLLFGSMGEYLPTVGTRYLLIGDIGNAATQESVPAWSPNGFPLIAYANDIIEFDGTRWTVTFDSRRSSDKQYITNLTTGIQYCWTGETWARAHDGIYRGGKWSLIL